MRIICYGICSEGCVGFEDGKCKLNCIKSEDITEEDDSIEEASEE